MRGFDGKWSFFIFTILVISSSVFLGQDAARGACVTFITTQAEGPGGTKFNFTTTAPGVEDFSLSDGETSQFLFSGSGTFVVLEDVQPGWALDTVECLLDGDVSFMQVDGGVEIDCPSGMNSIQCTFVNTIAPTNVPALSEWALVILAGVLCMAGIAVALRRRAAA